MALVEGVEARVRRKLRERIAERRQEPRPVRGENAAEKARAGTESPLGRRSRPALTLREQRAFEASMELAARQDRLAGTVRPIGEQERRELDRGFLKRDQLKGSLLGSFLEKVGARGVAETLGGASLIAGAPLEQELSKLPGGALRPDRMVTEPTVAEKRLRRQGFDKAGLLGKTGIVASNLLKDATSVALGFPAGVTKMVVDTPGAAKAAREGIQTGYLGKLDRALPRSPLPWADNDDTEHNTRKAWSEFGHELVDHPLFPALDIFAGLTGGTALAGKAGLIDVPAATRQVAYGDLTAQPYASPNPLVRRGQHRRDRRSEELEQRIASREAETGERSTDVPPLLRLLTEPRLLLDPRAKVGVNDLRIADADSPSAKVASRLRLSQRARDRVARLTRQDLERNSERRQQLGMPFQIAARKLSDEEDVAGDAFRRYGDKAPLRLEQEIEWRLGMIADGDKPLSKGVNANGETVYQLRGDPRRTTTDPAEAEPRMSAVERRQQEDTIAKLSAAREIVAAKSVPAEATSRLARSVEEARKVADLGQATKTELGFLDPQDAQGAIDRSSRLVTGGEYVTTPAPTRTLTDARARAEQMTRMFRVAAAKRDKAADKKIGKAEERQAAIDEQAATVPDEAARLELLAKREAAGLSRMGAGTLVGEGKVLGAPGQPLVERLGGAASVAKDKVEALEARAERRHGVVPGEKGGRELVGGDAAGEGAFYGPDIPKLTRRERLFPARKRVTLNKIASPVQGRNEGVLFTTGRAERSLKKTTLTDLKRTLKHLDDVEAQQVLAAVSKPPPASGLKPKGHEWFNPSGIHIPRRMKEVTEGDLQRLSPDELLDELGEDRRIMFNDVFPSDKQVAEMPEAMRAKLRVVDDVFVSELEGQVVTRQPGVLGQVFDVTNDVSKAALIYLKGAYVPANFTGNMAFGTIHEGVWLPRNLAVASGKIGDFSKESRAWMDFEVGTGGAQNLGGNSKGVIGQATEALANVSGKFADRLPRRAAIVHELRRIGITNEAELKAFRAKVDGGDKEAGAKLKQASERAERAMVKFRGLSPEEQKILVRAIFVYPWIKGATRYGGDLAIHHPLRAELVANLGEVGAEDTLKRLGQLTSYFSNLIPIGGPYEKYGTVVHKVVSGASTTPVGTAAEVLDTARGVLQGGTRRSPGDYVTPAIDAAVQGAFRFDTFLGRPHPASKSRISIVRDSLLGTRERPKFPLPAAIATAFRDKQTEDFEGPPHAQHNFSQEGGLLDALKMAAFGPARTRELNLPAAQAKGREEQLELLTPERRAVAREQARQRDMLEQARKHGIFQEPETQKELRAAFASRTRREYAYAKAAKAADVPLNRFRAGNPEHRLKVDLDLLVADKKIERAYANEIMAVASELNPDQVADLRADFVEMFGETFYTELRSILKQLEATK